MKIEGKLAIITGGASGLGEATVVEIVKQGGTAVIFDLNEEKVQKLIQKLGKDKVFFYKVDVTNEQEVAEAFQKVFTKFKRVNIVLNSAGIGYVEETFDSQGNMHDTNAFKKVIEINLIGVFIMCKYAAKYMSMSPKDENGERGVIINVSSIASMEGTRGQIAYSASKGGINGMLLPMARDIGKYNIRVMVIAPGPFDTGIAMASYANKLKAAAILERFGRPPEFANLVCAIVNNTYLTGTIIRLDGGLRKPHL